MEGRDPSPAFSSWLYCMLYPDVKASGMNPLLHYLRHGRLEGRLAPPAFVIPVSNVRGDEDRDARARAAPPVLRRLSEWTSKLLDPETVADGLPEGDVGLRDRAAAQSQARALNANRPCCPSRHSRHSPATRTAKAICSPPGPPAGVDGDSRAASTGHRIARPSAWRRALIARRSRWLVRWFAAIFARDLASSFQAVRLLGTIPAVRGPLVVFTNHPSWWDAELFAWLAATAFSERRAFAAMDSANLARYRLLSRLGAFPTRPRLVRRGRRPFWSPPNACSRRPTPSSTSLPRGRFRDVRERPIRPMPGLAHLARRIPEATFVPLAIDYAFWNERRPNLLLRFGEPIRAGALAGVDQGRDDGSPRSGFDRRHVDARRGGAIPRAAAIQDAAGGPPRLRRAPRPLVSRPHPHRKPPSQERRARPGGKPSVTPGRRQRRGRRRHRGSR